MSEEKKKGMSALGGLGIIFGLLSLVTFLTVISSEPIPETARFSDPKAATAKVETQPQKQHANTATPSKSKKPIGTAQAYTLVEKSVDVRHAINRTKVNAVINSPNAKTFNDRVATLVKAARDLRRTTEGTSVSVVLNADTINALGHPYQLGWVTYIPDGRGISGQEPRGRRWEAQVSDIQLTEKDIRIMAAWFKHRTQFKDQFGLTDEPRLIKHLSKVLQLPEDEIKLPYAKMRKVSQAAL